MGNKSLVDRFFEFSKNKKEASHTDPNTVIDSFFSRSDDQSDNKRESALDVERRLRDEERVNKLPKRVAQQEIAEADDDLADPNESEEPSEPMVNVASRQVETAPVEEHILKTLMPEYADQLRNKKGIKTSLFDLLQWNKPEGA